MAVVGSGGAMGGGGEIRGAGATGSIFGRGAGLVTEAAWVVTIGGAAGRGAGRGATGAGGGVWPEVVSMPVVLAGFPFPDRPPKLEGE